MDKYTNISLSEATLQQQCFTWHWNAFPEFRGLLFHIPNGGYRNKAEAARFKGMGVVPGIPDLCYVFRGKVHFFELKASTGRLSGAQKHIIELFSVHGHTTTVINSFEAFTAEINAIHEHSKQGTPCNVK